MISEFLAYFHCTCAETAISELPVKNLTPPCAPATAISSKTGIFPLSDDVYSIYLMFCAQFYLTLWPWPLTFDLGGVWWIKSLTHQTHIQIFSTLKLSIPELCVSQSDHITITWNRHCACPVSRDLCIGGPPKPHVTMFWPRIVYSLYNFYGATLRNDLYCVGWGVKLYSLTRWRLRVVYIGASPC